MKHLFLMFSVILFIGGCASSLTVDKLKEFTPESKILVLTDSSRFDAKIRKELAKKGFKVLKFLSTQKVVAKGEEGEIARVYNEAEARYGLTFYENSI